jgi:acetyl-CoA C-acetyltransferase
MTDVIIAGIGQTEVGEHWGIALRDLAYAAIKEALADSGGLQPQALFAGNMLAPNLSNQAHLGVLLADHCGLRGIEAVTVEAAGASGGAALRQGYMAVKSGFVDAALVVGVEKFTDQVGAGVDQALATTSDSDFEAVQGLTASGQAALLMRRYMHEYSVPADGLAGFALVAHANGAGNPNAMFRKAIKAEVYAKAEMVSDPINLFDAAPNADGAAAVLLTRSDLLPKEYSHPLVKIAASAVSGRRVNRLRQPVTKPGFRWSRSISSSTTTRTVSTPRSRWKQPVLPRAARAGDWPPRARLRSTDASPARRWAG